MTHDDDKKRKAIIHAYSLYFSQVLYPDLCIYSKRCEYSNSCKNRNVITRLSWRSFCSSTHDKQFRRMFRMNKTCFDELCASIVNAVGDSSFKSEEFLESHQHQVSGAHNISSGGSISGEVKLALTLCILSGASYLDLEKIFHLSFRGAYRIFNHVLK